MRVYIASDDNWLGLYSAASGDMKARFTTEQGALDYAEIWGWVVVSNPFLDNDCAGFGCVDGCSDCEAR